MIYVLDTHILIWYFIGSKRLKTKLKEKIDEARKRGARLLVPTIVLAEALSIAERGKVAFDFQRMYHLIKDEAEFEIVNFTSVINKKGVITVSDTTAAEAVKLFEGIYRDVNIALSNELALISREIGVSPMEIFPSSK